MWKLYKSRILSFSNLKHFYFIILLSREGNCRGKHTSRKGTQLNEANCHITTKIFGPIDHYGHTHCITVKLGQVHVTKITFTSPKGK